MSKIKIEVGCGNCKFKFAFEGEYDPELGIECPNCQKWLSFPTDPEREAEDEYAVLRDEEEGYDD